MAPPHHELEEDFSVFGVVFCALESSTLELFSSFDASIHMFEAWSRQSIYSRWRGSVRFTVVFYPSDNNKVVLVVSTLA